MQLPRVLLWYARRFPDVALIAVLMAIDAVWLMLGNWAVHKGSLAGASTAVLGFALLGSLPRYRDDARIGPTLRAAAVLVAFTAATSVLSYLVVSTRAPLIDDLLAHGDALLGFDWEAAYRWLAARPDWHRGAQVAYASGLPQIALVTVVLGMTGQRQLLNEFVRLFMAATLVCIVASAFLPAAGPWSRIDGSLAVDTSPMSHFALLRDGTMRTIDLAKMQGLISIPSLHTVVAVLLIWAVRSAGPLIFWPIVALNVAMIGATPVEGGHYVVDVIAGAGLALALVVCNRITARVKPESKMGPMRTPDRPLSAIRRTP